MKTLRIDGKRYIIRGNYNEGDLKRLYKSFQNKYPESELTFQQWLVDRGKIHCRLKNTVRHHSLRTNGSRKSIKHDLQARYTINRSIVAKGKCLDCGADLKRNSALAGWWQCVQFGSEQFRKDPTKPSCNFQIFTE